METRTHYFHESAQKVLSCRERNSWNDEREREREVKNLAIALKKEKKKRNATERLTAKSIAKWRYGHVSYVIEWHVRQFKVNSVVEEPVSTGLILYSCRTMKPNDKQFTMDQWVNQADFWPSFNLGFPAVWRQVGKSRWIVPPWIGHESKSPPLLILPYHYESTCNCIGFSF